MRPNLTVAALLLASILGGCKSSPPPAAPATASETPAVQPAVAPTPSTETASAAVAAPATADVRIMLQEANAYAANGDVEQASQLYQTIMAAPNVSRDWIAAAATGLYRIGDYGNAVTAFAKLGTFARGEEDLRYYNAVSLYETGQYAAAKRELACALPYIEVTSEVQRTRDKIEQMASPPH